MVVPKQMAVVVAVAVVVEVIEHQLLLEGPKQVVVGKVFVFQLRVEVSKQVAVVEVVAVVAVVALLVGRE